MPKGVPFAEGLSALEYDTLARERPYVTQLVDNGGNFRVEPLMERLKQTHIALSREEQYFLSRVNLHLRKQLYIAVQKYNTHNPRWVSIAPENSKSNINALLEGVTVPPIAKNARILRGNKANFNQKAINPFLYLGDDDLITREAIDRLHITAPKKQYQLDRGYTSNGNIVLNQQGVDNLIRMARDSRAVLDALNAGVERINAYQTNIEEQRRREETAKQEELKRKAQEAAARASYEDALNFKTEEFNRALNAQKIESEIKHRQLLEEFDRQTVNIRTDMTRAHQEELIRRDEEFGRRLAKQREDYESQLSARRLEEAKRKQEAEVMQSNLKRRIAIYEAGRGANLHFVGLNGKDGQSKGARVFVNSGGRYIRSRISYNPNGGMQYLNNGSEDSNVPDLFLDMLANPNNSTKKKRRSNR